MERLAFAVEAPGVEPALEGAEKLEARRDLGPHPSEITGEPPSHLVPPRPVQFRPAVQSYGNLTATDFGPRRSTGSASSVPSWLSRIMFVKNPTGSFTVVNPAGAGGIVAAVHELLVPLPLEVVA